MPSVLTGTGAPFKLWAVDLATESSDAEVATLSWHEQARAQRFRFRRDRRRYLAAHVGLRRILAEHTHFPAAAQQFEAGAHGKPKLTGAPGLDFNLSYAGDFAVVGVADGFEIGVDVEERRTIADRAALSESLFTVTERAAYEAAPPGAAHDLIFLRGWTRKESCIKAIGTGLSTDPATFETGMDEDVRTASVVRGDAPVAIEVGSFKFGSCLGAWARIA